MKPKASKMGALATPKSSKNELWDGIQKRLRKLLKRGGPGTFKLTAFLRKIAKKNIPPGKQIDKKPFWVQCRKDNQTKSKKNTNCTKLPLGPLGSETPHTHCTKTPPNHDYGRICLPSGLICHRFVVHMFNKCSPCSCSLVCVREKVG